MKYFILLFLSLISHPTVGQENNQSIIYEGGEMYQVFYNGKEPITRPIGLVKSIVYDKFYKSYVIFYKTQDTPDGSMVAATFNYLSEKIENGKTIMYCIESNSKDVYFTFPETLESSGTITFIRQEPIDGVIYGIAIKNTKK